MDINPRISWGYINKDDHLEGWFIRQSDKSSDRWATKYFDVPGCDYMTVQGTDQEIITHLFDTIDSIEPMCRQAKETFEQDMLQISNISISDFV